MRNPSGPLVLFHGAQRWTGAPELKPAGKNKSEAGSGLYLTTSTDTARKYAKGGGQVLRFEVAPLTFADEVRLPLVTVEAFVQGLPRLKHKQAIIDDLYRFVERTGKSELPAYVVENLMHNHGALTGAFGPALAQFFVEQGVDASLVTHGSEDWVVLYNLDKIVSYRKATQAEQLQDAPRVRKNPTPTRSRSVIKHIDAAGKVRNGRGPGERSYIEFVKLSADEANAVLEEFHFIDLDEGDDDFFDGGILYINNIEIDPTLRGKGLGKKLLEAATKGVTEDVWLISSPTGSTDPEGFYAKLGFEAVDRNRYDQVLMRRRPARSNPLMIDSLDDPFEPTFHKAASKARRKALCYHGTSSVWFWPIVENGFSFDEERKAWDNTSPGVFVAFNESATQVYASRAVQRFGGMPICFVLEVPIKTLGIDVDDRMTHDKNRNWQGMSQAPIPASCITGVLLPKGYDPDDDPEDLSIDWGEEIPIKDFIRSVNAGRYKSVDGLKPWKTHASMLGKDPKAKHKLGKASPIDHEHAVLKYLVDVLNYTSLADWLLQPKWGQLSRVVLENILSGRLPNWRMMDARQWLAAVETMTGEKNEEPYFDSAVEDYAWMRRPFYEVATKFATTDIDQMRGIRR